MGMKEHITGRNTDCRASGACHIGADNSGCGIHDKGELFGSYGIYQSGSGSADFGVCLNRLCVCSIGVLPRWEKDT